MRLLKVLKPVPREWVEKAQHTISEMLSRGGSLVVETALTDADVAAFGRELERDRSFRRAFDVDPVAAADERGWPELARVLERELRALVALAERIAADEAFRAELDVDVATTLVAVGVPEDAAEPVLLGLGMPDELLAKLPEVVAHMHEQEPLRTRLLTLLLGATAVGDSLRKLATRT